MARGGFDSVWLNGTMVSSCPAAYHPNHSLSLGITIVSPSNLTRIKRSSAPRRVW